MKTIAVISMSVENFRSYMRSNFPEAISSRTSRRVYDLNIVSNHKRFICIVSPEHIRGCRFDEIKETIRAKENQRYDELVSYSRFCLPTPKKVMKINEISHFLKTSI